MPLNDAKQQCLRGRRILITRSSAQSAEFRRLLEDAGATVLEVPTIEIRPRRSAEIDRAVENLSSYDWLMFTSINGARIFLGRASNLGKLPDPASPPRICTIGPATARGVKEFGLPVNLIPSLFQAEGILEEFARFQGGDLSGIKILLPRASQAREILPEELRRRGAQVDLIPVYDTAAPEGSRQLLEEAFRDGPPDLVTFTSSSTVHNFVALAENDEILKALSCAAIGPITAGSAAEYGLQVAVQPENATIADLAEAIRRHFGG